MQIVAKTLFVLIAGFFELLSGGEHGFASDPPTDVAAIKYGEANSASSDASKSDASKSVASYNREPVDVVLFDFRKYPDSNWQPDDLKFEDVWFTSKDGTKIHGWLCRAANPKAVVLYAHGNAGNITHRRHLLKKLQTEMSVTVLAFDYRGYGRSEGVPTQAGALDDARAARTFLANATSAKETDVVLMGRSFGGAIVIQLAAESPARALIVESTFCSLKEEALHVAPRLAFLVHPDRFNSVISIAEHKGSLLHSHGSADRLIPYSQGVKLFQAANHPKTHVRIPGGQHNDPYPRPQYDKIMRQFIADLPD